MSATISSPVPTVNRQFRLAAVPVGMPAESDFTVASSPMVSPGDGQVLVKSVYWSVDPYMRGRITGVRSYADPVLVGDVMVGGAAGEVLESKSSAFQAGDFVSGFWGWQEYFIANGKELQKLNPAVAPISSSLGILGMPGMTAYFGFLEICQPKPGETVVVSGAAGAVGSYVGQLAKIKGCRVIGIAGSDDKVDYLVKELGFDAAFNYKKTTDYAAQLKDLCPKGIDCYFDNVGGASRMPFFRCSTCTHACRFGDRISQYNLRKPEPGPRLLSYILVKQVRVEGFIVLRFTNRFPEGFQQMAQWLKEGKLKYREQVMEGFENIPKAFIAMLNGVNTGKMLVKA